MSTRTWLFQRMQDDATLLALVPGGVHQTTEVQVTPHLKPYIIYRQTSDVERLRGDDQEVIRVLGYMLMVHDMPGDYMSIDEVMERLKVLFRDIVDQANGVVKSIWIETSEDQRDDDMGTILKWGRIQVIYKV